MGKSESTRPQPWSHNEGIRSIAGDKDPAGYLRVELKDHTGPPLTLEPPVTRMSIPHPELAQDIEGIAVRAGKDGGSLITVLWEGGYPRPDKSLSSDGVDSFPMLPFIVIPPLEAYPAGLQHEIEQYSAIPLHVPRPEGDGPEAQRFRAPDLVWHRLPDGSWGFIVLLSSEDLVDESAYHHR